MSHQPSVEGAVDADDETDLDVTMQYLHSHNHVSLLNFPQRDLGFLVGRRVRIRYTTWIMSYIGCYLTVLLLNLMIPEMPPHCAYGLVY